MLVMRGGGVTYACDEAGGVQCSVYICIHMTKEGGGIVYGSRDEWGVRVRMHVMRGTHACDEWEESTSVHACTR